MLGITSAYFLSKRGCEVTVIDKDNPIRGATEQNGNTVTFIPYPAWTTINVKQVIKDTLTFSSTPLCYFRPSLLLDSHFRFWVRKYFKNRNSESVKQSNAALARLTKFSISLFDKFMDDCTENNPDLVEYHFETLHAIYNGLSEKEIQEKRELVEYMKKFEEETKLVCPERYDASFAYNIPLRCFNTGRFVNYMRTRLSEKHGVHFLDGEIKAVTCSDSQIQSLEYSDSNLETKTLEGFDKYVVCAGIESVNIGKMVGLKVPLMGFKGYSLNVFVEDKEIPEFSFIRMPETICISRVGYNTGGMVRVTGFADIDGNNTDPVPWRKDMLIEMAKKFVSEDAYDESKASHWVGLRPLCADDVPLIGKSSKFNNLFWNTGHGPRGITQSVGSALLLDSLISGHEIPKDLVAEDYNPRRFDI